MIEGDESTPLFLPLGGVMLERDYQLHVIKQLRRLFPDAVVLKNDTSYMQGVPDLLILIDGWWGMLEVKKSSRSSVQPNQEFYVERLNIMSFAEFIYPEVEGEVLDALQRSYAAYRAARISQSE
jgi:hypothetical protein